MIEYIEKGIGLHDAIAAAGHWLRQIDGEWRSSDDTAVQAIIDAYDPLPGLRDELYAQVAAERIRRQEAGVPYVFPSGDTGRIQVRNAQDLANLNGIATRAMMAIQAGVTAPVFPFRDQEDRTHPMTPQQISELCVAASDRVTALYQAKWAHDDAIAAWNGSHPYDTAAFWPEI